MSDCTPATSVRLPVLDDHGVKHHGIKPSRASRWRAAVLIIVHVLMIAHIVQWLLSDRGDGVRSTLSPIEPSESMFTLEAGRLNAGFVFFCLAIVVTLVCGRFFCGWLCHIIAVQDLCGWMMRKIGIHPKPFRSRLLLWSPLVLALYMFVWPTFRRVVLLPWIGKDLNGDGRVTSDFIPGKGWEFPPFLGEVMPLHHFTKHYVVENFWATFAPWYLAIPFILVCGFLVVYFLGSKSFCAYGCPYGGFFGPVDRLAPGRIRVNDNCHHCGHCTAACTSNVRVHEEVRDYGMVVDPGCMKTLDCVSVCPNDALSVSFGTPAAFASPRVDEAAMTVSREKAAKRWDLSLGEELVLGVVFFALIMGFRGMYNAVPLLMAMGLAMLGTFGLWKTWRLLRDRNVRGPFWQLKRDGRWKPIGVLFAVGTIAFAVLGVQGMIMNFSLGRGERRYGEIVTPRDKVFASGYSPTPEDRDAAQAAVADFTLAGSRSRGGVGFLSTYGGEIRLAWLHAVAGERDKAEAALRRAIDMAPPSQPLLGDLALFMSLRQAPMSELETTLRSIRDRHPEANDPRVMLTDFYLRTNRPEDAWGVFDTAVKRDPRDIPAVVSAAQLAVHLARLDDPSISSERRAQYRARATAMVTDGLAHYPNSPALNEAHAGMLFDAEKPTEALAALERSMAHKQNKGGRPDQWMFKAAIFRALGKTGEADHAVQRANDLSKARGEQQTPQPDIPASRR